MVHHPTHSSKHGTPRQIHLQQICKLKLLWQLMCCVTVLRGANTQAFVPPVTSMWKNRKLKCRHISCSTNSTLSFGKFPKSFFPQTNEKPALPAVFRSVSLLAINIQCLKLQTFIALCSEAVVYGVRWLSDPPDSVTPGHCVQGLSDPLATESYRNDWPLQGLVIPFTILASLSPQSSRYRSTLVTITRYSYS